MLLDEGVPWGPCKLPPRPRDSAASLSHVLFTFLHNFSGLIHFSPSPQHLGFT